MFKKIEIWILYLTILLSILFAFAFGVLVRQEIEGITKKGSIDISFLSRPAASIARLPEQFLQMLLKPNPNRLSDPWEDPRDFYFQQGFKGTPNISESYLLLSRYDGDLEEGLVELVNLQNFKILHTWNPDIDKFNKKIKHIEEFKFIERDSNNYRQLLRHPYLSSNGYLFFKQDSPLRVIDECSELIYQNTHDRFHHSIESDIDGNIWIPTHQYPQSLDKTIIGRNKRFDNGYEDDAVLKISPEGTILFEKSVSEIFIENDMEYLLFSVGDKHFDTDPIHLNDIQPVKADSQYWKKGDIFISLRHQSMVLLYRPSTNKILWKGVGKFFHQHDVNIIDDHRISVFNNNSKDFIDGNIVDGNNEVIIYDFSKDKYTTYLNDSMKNSDIRTVTQGRSKILPNGDLFIEESNYGRTLYFNSDGSIRWTHVNLADDANIYNVGWSRILFTEKDIQTVNNFLKNKETCNE
tara:strand:+ start:1415 stop:2809 length:1395 start_codon:yes stop_codon:yes gene_type:complete